MAGRAGRFGAFIVAASLVLAGSVSTVPAWADDPDPAPTVEPTAEPTPTEEPAPSPDPTGEPQPEPSPEPDPEADPADPGWTIDDQLSPAKYPADQPGDVTISGPFPLTVATTGWPIGTTFTYQWYSGSTPTTTTKATGPGAKTASYAPVAADYGKHIRVRVTATVPGYDATPRDSDAKIYSILGSGLPAVTGSPKVGTTLALSQDGLLYWTVDGGVPGMETAVQWLRNGSPIPGATGTSYALTGPDAGTKISVRVTASALGLLPRITTSPALTVAVKGTIAASSPAATMTKTVDADGFFLTAGVTGVTEPGTAISYRWYRVNRSTQKLTAISGATGSTYRPKASDHPYEITVRATVTKSGYDTLVLTAEPKDYSLRLEWPLQLADTELHAGEYAFVWSPLLRVELEDGATQQLLVGDTTSAWSWYRNGKLLPGEEFYYLELGPGDVGAKFQIGLTASVPGWLPLPVTKSAASAKVRGPAMSTLAPAHISHSGMTLTALPAAMNEPPDKVTYQWYRGGKKVKGATASTYRLSAADFGKNLAVLVTHKRAGFADLVQWAVSDSSYDEWYVRAESAPVITGDLSVGGELSLAPNAFYDLQSHDPMDAGSLEFAYQWMADGKKIAGATGPTLTLTAAQKGKRISVRLTAAPVAGHLVPYVGTSATTQKVGARQIDGADAATLEVVTAPDSSTFAPRLRAQLSGVTGVSVAYQWYRGDAKIKGATKQTYALTAKDRDRLIRVVATVSKKAQGSTTFTTFVLGSTARDYTLVSSGGHVVFDPEPRVGAIAYALPTAPIPPWTAAVDPGDYRYSFQWLRNGTAIKGATGSTYTVGAADYGTRITVRVTAGVEGDAFLPVTAVFGGASAPIAKGVALNVPTFQVLPTDVAKLTVSHGYVSPSEPAPAWSYQWFRDGTAIKGATKQTYTLKSADRGAFITVQVTMKRKNFVLETMLLGTSSPRGVTLVAEAPLTISHPSGLEPGAQVSAAVPIMRPDDNPGGFFSGDLRYQWYRNGKAIAGATDWTYVLKAADVGKKITVKMTALAWGRLPLTLTSAPVTPAG